LIAENIKIKIYRIIIFPVACMGVKGDLSPEGGTLVEGVGEKGAEEDIPGKVVVEKTT
jgi:hypothetical protein